MKFRLSETLPKRTFPTGKVVWWSGAAQGENISKLIYCKIMKIIGNINENHEHFLVRNLWIWYTKSLGFYEKLLTLMSCNFLSFGNQIANQKSGITSSSSSFEWILQILRISGYAYKKPPLVFADLRKFVIRNPPLFSAKIIYENTTFPKNFRACGAKLFTKTQHLPKSWKTRGDFL